MPTITTLGAFIVAVLAMQLVPGPETLLVVSRGIGEGRQTAMWTVLGMTLVAGAIQLPLLVLGITSMVGAWPWAYEAIRLAGATYLIVIGARLLLLRPNESAAAKLGDVRIGRVAAVRDGFIANMTNPNPLLFMLAFLPQFADPTRGSLSAQLLALGAIQKVTGFAVLAVTALVSGSLGAWIARHRPFVVWQRRFAGAAMIMFGLSLVARGPS